MNNLEANNELPAQYQKLTIGKWFRNIFDAITSTYKGMRITLRYVYAVKEVTIQYPEEKEELPEISRSRLFNDVLNCTSCLQCASICPVDCIYITATKRAKDAPKVAAEDGTPIRMDLQQYTIDTALCCYCGLCTTVCPTNCITHSTDYEYSEFMLDGLKYNYLDEDVRSWRDRIVVPRQEKAAAEKARAEASDTQVKAEAEVENKN